MIYIGAMMGLINSLERITENPIPIPHQRWPWQQISSSIPDYTSTNLANNSIT
jgi:hypothetical protein